VTGTVTHKPPFHPDRRLFPFDSKWYESRVGPVHYIDEGSGPPILFLHGNPTWSFLYRGIIIRLKKRFRCIAVDYPGFGLSVRPENYDYTPADHAGIVAGLVRHLDLRGLTIMGHEWGGPIGMRVAADEAPRMRALVMGNTWYWPLDVWYVKTFAYVMASAPMQTQILRHNFYVEKVMPAAVKYPFAEEVLHHYREALPTPKSRVGVAELPRQLMEASLWLGDLAEDVHDKLSAVPVLLTWGIDDVAFPRHFMERFREDFDDVTIHRLDAKHYIQEDAPGEIAGAIEEFLGDLEPRP
jgi:haloalkane dehalogenase